MRCKESFFWSPRKYEAEFYGSMSNTSGVRNRHERTFVTIMALIRPVCGIWGPAQRSIMGPQR
jgi:hypothetical protein